MEEDGVDRGVDEGDNDDGDKDGALDLPYTEEISGLP